MWVARDKNNQLTLFSRKPYRSNDYWWIKPKEYLKGFDDYDSVIGDWVIIDSSLFPELTWEDEPIEVTLVNSIQYKNEKLAYEYMFAVYKNEHKDNLFTLITDEPSSIDLDKLDNQLENTLKNTSKEMYEKLVDKLNGMSDEDKEKEWEDLK